MIKEPKKIVIINIIIKAIVNVLNIIGFKKNVDYIKKWKKTMKSFLGIYTQNNYFILMLSKCLLWLKKIENILFYIFTKSLFVVLKKLFFKNTFFKTIYPNRPRVTERREKITEFIGQVVFRGLNW